MAVNYSVAAINARLEGVVDTIDGGGGNASLILQATGSTISTISLARPCGSVDGGVLTFDGTLLDPSASSTGYVDSAKIETSGGDAVITGLTVGIPLSGADVIVSNGLNSTLITAGQTVELLSAEIIGS